MENRKFIRVLILIFVFGFFVINSNSVFAYEIDTHAYLTSEIINFYNQNLPNQQISDELKDYLIDGSRREDDPPRWMNHFYDPVYNRGLTDSGLGIWQKSKDWAQDSDNQTKLKYSPIIATILSSWQSRKIQKYFPISDFTWREAVRYWVQDDKEMAMFTLGHVLHLLEDKAVPDHTRNDPHLGDSPYEIYTQQFALINPDKNLLQRLTEKSPILFSDLNSYFDELANYSNNNFYSKDRIGKESGYDLPNPDTEGLLKRDGDYYYMMKYDEDNNLYHLSVYKNYRNSILLETKSNIVLKIEDEDKVVKDYWSRLSTKSVQYGAGVINLFFQEVEKAKNDPNFTKQEDKSFLGKVIDKIKNLTGNVISSAGDLLSGVFSEDNQNFQPAGEIGLTDSNQNNNQSGEIQVSQSNNQYQEIEFQTDKKETENKTANITESPTNKKAPAIRPEDDEEIQETANTVRTEQTTTTQRTSGTENETPILQATNYQECSFTINQQAIHSGVIINEVAWMGTANSANDEWIELKNVSGGEINLNGWQLIDQGEQIKIIFESNDKISANGLYLLERTDDNSVPSITADKIYSGALSNTNEGLRLFDNQCNLIDEVLASPNWPAGDNTSAAERKTMERNSNDFNWHTSSVIGGTPKAANSPGYVAYSGGGGGVSSVNQSPSDNTQQQSQTLNHIVISEIQAGVDGNADNEFIEFWNPTEQAIDLTGWALKKKTSSGSEYNLVSAGSFSGAIPAKGFFLIAHQTYQGGRTPDLYYSNNSNPLAYANNSVVVYNASGAIVDEITYSDIPKNQSFERKAFQNNVCVSSQGDGEFLGHGCDTDTVADFSAEGGSVSDWEIRLAPNPQNSQSPPEPRSSPAAVQSFNVSYSSSAMELVFNWQPSQDYSGATSTVVYEIQEYSSPGASIFRASSTDVFRKKINEIGRDYQFSIQAFDKEGLGSASSTVTASVPSFLKEVYFYKDPRYTTSTKYLLELTYDKYPILPDSNLSLMSAFGPGNNFKAMIFYSNREARKDEYMKAAAASSSEALPIKYKKCNGYYSEASALVLSDSGDNCRSSGEFYTNPLQFSYLEDKRIFLETASSSMSVSPNDYITIAYYGFERNYPPYTDGGDKNFKLIAVDKTKYYFQNSPPSHQPPAPPSNLQFSFNADTSNLTVSFSASTDPDTLNNSITYELNYATSSEAGFAANAWQSIGTNTSGVLEVIFNNTYTIGARAVDEFGNVSAVATGSWSFPSDFAVIQQQRLKNREFNVGANAVAQVFEAGYSGYAKSLQIFSQTFYNGMNGSIRAFLYDTDNPDSAGSGNLLASSNSENVWGGSSGGTHTLSFQERPFLEAGRKYLWMVNFSGLSSNFAGICENKIGGSGWARFSKWQSGNCNDAANNYYFVLIGSTSP